MPDQILLQGMQFYGYHGVNPEERVLGQRYVVDLTADLDLSPAGKTDRLEDTVSYSHIYRTVRTVMEGEPRNLLESAAEAIADRVLAEFPVNAVSVTVKKPNPPVRGSSIELAAVRIHRSRSQASQSQGRTSERPPAG